ncbi:CFAP45, partial [Symbiodinium microadriaticum]
AELDEIRARRAAEARERKIREAERDAARKRKEDLKNLTQARAKQAEDKRRRLEAEKNADLIEIEHAKEYAKKMNAREEAEAAHKARLSEEHRINIRKQIDEAEEKRRRDRMAKYDEGSGNRDKFIQDQARLEAIREKMVRDLEEKGVNPKYMSEMKNVDIKKILNR